MSFRRPYREQNEVFTPTPNQFDTIMQPHNPMFSNLGGVAFETNTMGGVAFETNTMGGVAMDSNTLGAGFTDALNMFQFANMLFPK
jgi:hypothetical protein